MFEDNVRVFSSLHNVHRYLVRLQQLDPLFPHVVGFTHGYPNVSVDNVHALDTFFDVVGYDDLGTSFLGNFVSLVQRFLSWFKFLRRYNVVFHTHNSGTQHQSVGYVVLTVTNKGKLDVLVVLLQNFLSSQEVSQNLGWVVFISQTVPNWHTRVLSQNFNVALGEATVFNTIEHPTQYASRVLNGFLVANVRTRWAKVSYVSTFVFGTNFK